MEAQLFNLFVLEAGLDEEKNQRNKAEKKR